MSMTDPIADFLTRIRNGLRADHELVDMPASKFKSELARILHEQGYIEAYSDEPGRVGHRRRRRQARAISRCLMNEPAYDANYLVSGLPLVALRLFAAQHALSHHP